MERNVDTKSYICKIRVVFDPQLASLDFDM